MKNGISKFFFVNTALPILNAAAQQVIMVCPITNCAALSNKAPCHPDQANGVSAWRDLPEKVFSFKWTGNGKDSMYRFRDSPSTPFLASSSLNASGGFLDTLVVSPALRTEKTRPLCGAIHVKPLLGLFVTRSARNSKECVVSRRSCSVPA